MTQEACVECRVQWQLTPDSERHPGGAEIGFCLGGAHNASRWGEEAATITAHSSGNSGLRTMPSI